MSDKDIDYIELCLGYSLPHEYRVFLARHSDELRRIKELLPCRAVIWTDPDEIIRTNEWFRRHADQMPVDDKRSPWPENYLVVGTNGAGDYWFAHRDGSKTGLWLWDHEGQYVRHHYLYLSAYLADLRQDSEFPERWQRGGPLPVAGDKSKRSRGE